MRLRDLEAQSVLRAGERHGAFVVYRDPSQVDDGFLSALLPDPDRLFEAGQAIQSPWQSAATDKTIVEIRGKSYFLKRYNCLGSRYRLKSIVRTSRALKSGGPAGSFWSWGYRRLVRSLVWKSVAFGSLVVHIFSSIIGETRGVFSTFGVNFPMSRWRSFCQCSARKSAKCIVRVSSMEIVTGATFW